MPTYDNSTFSSASGVTTHSFSFSTTGTDRCLLMACHAGDANFSATYNSVSMTEHFDGSLGSPGFRHIAVYSLANPASGSNTLAITLSVGNGIAVGVASYTGVDQTTPVDGFATENDGNTTAKDIVITSESGDLVVDFLALNLDTSQTVGSGQTARVNQGDGDSFVSMHISEEAGASSVTMSWTVSLSSFSAHAGLNLNAASGGATGRIMSSLTFDGGLAGRGGIAGIGGGLAG